MLYLRLSFEKRYTFETYIVYDMAEVLNTKGKRIYFVEFLRLFLILSVFLVHVGDWIDPELKRSVLRLCNTQAWHLADAVRYFFIIGGFFLYRKAMKIETGTVCRGICKLWIRLMPGIIFFYALLVAVGCESGWTFPFAFFPTAGHGVAGALVGYSDWFMGVYFIASCLILGLFATNRQSAWLWLIAGMLVSWWIERNAHAGKGWGHAGTYYGFLAGGTIRGISCMGLGMVAAYLSEQWNLRRTVFLRVLASVLEFGALCMLVGYMCYPSRAKYDPIAVELVVAALLISASRSWGIISAVLNRCSGVTYLSRYTYSLLLTQGALVHYFRFNHNFGMSGHTCAWIILGAAVPLVLVEYHLIEGWLVPKIKRFFVPETN